VRQQGMYMRDMKSRVPHHRRRRASSRRPGDSLPHLSYNTTAVEFPEHLAMLLLGDVVISTNHNVIWWDPDDWEPARGGRWARLAPARASAFPFLTPVAYF